MTAVPNQPLNHNEMCQSAKGDKCKCTCRSLMHQKDILVATVTTAPPPPASNYQGSLQDIYGYKFKDYVTAPSTRKPERPGRRQWKSTTGGRVSAKRQASRTEQRLLDVTLADVLKNLHSTPTKSATWELFVADLCMYDTWDVFSARIKALCGAANPQSGYFWAGMLAATIAAHEKNVAAGGRAPWPPSTAQITAEASFVPSKGPHRLFARVQYPRAKTGGFKAVQEIQNSHVVTLAAQEIRRILASPRALSTADAELLTCVVGATVCADLWHHPAACRYLLRRAVELQRANHFTFSLDGAPGFPQLVEDQIDQELGLKWQVTGSW